jgi:ATP-dependent DNA ligase
MTSEKRQFSDFTKFPGCIDDTTGNFVFPHLYHKDSSNNTRIWTIQIRLIKGCEKHYSIDWDLLLDDTIPIKQSYIEGSNIPSGTIAQVWVETGVIGGKIVRHAPTYPAIKNSGKSNERNTFEQSLVLARSQYLKRYENGLRPESEFKKMHSTKTSHNVKYFPMLVRKYEEEKSNIIYPVYVQPKFDGARMIAYLNLSPIKNPTYENVILYTRQKKDYAGFDNIRKELLPALINMWDVQSNQSIYIDGELYKHGLNLQTISGAVRNPKRNEIAEYAGIKYHIFDIFYPSKLGLTLEFNERLTYLHELFSSFKSTDCVKMVKTVMAKDEKEQNKIYKDLLAKKYEGVILRNANSLYLTHPTKNSMSIRSKFVLKRKMTYADEFEVVGFEQGTKGRDIGAILWICKTPKTKKIFSVTPKNITYEERYKLFKEASKANQFDENFKGRMMTIEYEDLSLDEIPLRAKSIGFREHI